MAKKRRDDDAVLSTCLIVKAWLDDDDQPFFEIDAKPEEAAAAQALIRSTGEAMAQLKSTPRGSSGRDASDTAMRNGAVAATTIGKAIKAFAAEHQVKPKTARRYAPDLARLERHFGTTTLLRDITPSRFAEYAAAVKSESAADKTKNMRITVAGTFFRWCQSHFDDSPALSTDKLKIKRRSPEHTERQAFTLGELKALMDNAAKYRDNEPHKFWITAALAFTGMRVEELCQLDINADVQEDLESGFWYFKIHGEDGKSVKTLAGWRNVPLHPALIDAGFLNYVQSQRKLGAATLFPQWKARTDPHHGGHTYGHEAVKWSGRELKKLRAIGSVTTPKATYFHSMRHALINNLKQAMVDESVRAAIVGHEAGGINNNRYGKGFKVGILGRTLVEKLPEYAVLLHTEHE